MHQAGRLDELVGIRAAASFWAVLSTAEVIGDLVSCDTRQPSAKTVARPVTPNLEDAYVDFIRERQEEDSLAETA